MAQPIIMPDCSPTILVSLHKTCTR